MSEDESPLARWSRRKLAERSGEGSSRNAEQPASVETAVEAEAGAAPSPVAEEATCDAEACEPAEPLPSVEDLTPESDVAAFLREGVPKALKVAALRKMWSLDPGIRDYVGPAEYAWDFNQPGSMGGFGPLDPKDSVVDFLSRVGRTIDAEEPDASPETHLQEAAAPSAEPARSAAEGRGVESDGEETAPPATAISAPSQDATQTAAGANKPSEPGPRSESKARPRHGGAMPS